MFNKLNLIRFAALVVFASFTACKTTQPPEVIAVPEPAAVYVPEPVVAAPEPVPEPIITAPDQRWLPGHSSYTTPVPVEPVDVDEMGPVISE